MQQNRPNITALLICGLASLFYVYDFLLRVMPSAMTDNLMQHFHVGAGKLGLMLAIFYFAYAPMQIPAGLLFDRFGTRKLLTAMVLICAIGTFVFGISDNTIIASSGRFLIGFSSAFAFLGALVLASRWLPHKYFALFVGLIQLLGCAGAIAGERPIAIAVKHFGWQNTNLIAALLGLVLAILFWILLRDHPEGATIPSKKHANISALKRLRAVYKNSQNWWVGLYAFAIWAPTTIFPVLWGVPFIMTLYKLNVIAASGIMSFTWIGIGVGGPIIGWWSDHVRRRRLPLIATAIAGLVIVSCMLYLNNISIPMMCCILFLLGISISGMVVTFGNIKDNNHPAVVGTADGFNNMAILIGGMLFQPLVGAVLHALWDGKVVNNIPLYSLQNYQLALSILPICFLIAIISSLFFIKETHCQPQHPELV